MSFYTSLLLTRATEVGANKPRGALPAQLLVRALSRGYWAGEHQNHSLFIPSLEIEPFKLSRLMCGSCKQVWVSCRLWSCAVRLLDHRWDP